MRPSLLRRSQVWRARFFSFEAQLRRCRRPKSLTSGDRYAERIAMRPNVACRGSRRFSQSPRPAAIASSGSSGKFDKPSIAAISLNKKSSMKKDSESLVLENFSAARTDFGVFNDDLPLASAPPCQPASLRASGTVMILANSVSCKPALASGDRMHFDQLKRREFITLLGGTAAEGSIDFTTSAFR